MGHFHARNKGEALLTLRAHLAGALRSIQEHPDVPPISRRPFTATHCPGRSTYFEQEAGLETSKVSSSPNDPTIPSSALLPSTLIAKSDGSMHRTRAGRVKTRSHLSTPAHQPHKARGCITPSPSERPAPQFFVFAQSTRPPAETRTRSSAGAEPRFPP